MKLTCYICHQKYQKKNPVGFGLELETYMQYELEEHLRTHTVEEVIEGMARMHWSLGLGTFEREYGIRKKRRNKKK